MNRDWIRSCLLFGRDGECQCSRFDELVAAVWPWLRKEIWCPTSLRCPFYTLWTCEILTHRYLSRVSTVIRSCQQLLGKSINRHESISFVQNKEERERERERERTKRRKIIIHIEMKHTHTHTLTWWRLARVLVSSATRDFEDQPVTGGEKTWQQLPS